jgi:hypothetical protein
MRAYLVAVQAARRETNRSHQKIATIAKKSGSNPLRSSQIKEGARLDLAIRNQSCSAACLRRRRRIRTIRTVQGVGLFFSMPVPVAMLARRIVIVGAGVVKQCASEKKEDQFTLAEPA